VILAVDCREFVPGRVTGIGRFLQGILEEIACRRPHLAALAMALPETSLPASAPALRPCRLPGRPTLYWDQILLPRQLRTEGANVFFSPYYKAPLVAPCPTVVTVHDLIPIQFPAYRRGARRLFAAAFRSWAALLARRAAAVITDSAYSKASLVALLGVSAERTHAIPIGVGAEFVPGAPPAAIAAAAARYGISAPYLLTVGNFLPHKNLSRLVAAFERLPSSLRQRYRLVLAGSPAPHGRVGPEDPARPPTAGVVLPGFIRPEDLPLIYTGATALVCPSLMEGFGLPILEAMACGTPVVCARAGALPEVAGEAALYVDPLDATSIAGGIEQVLTDEGLRARLAAQGLTRALEFDARRTSARLVDLLEAIGRQGKDG
jgi:alpha-1,3-rhamnosyl/mannosyltransferase